MQTRPHIHASLLAVATAASIGVTLPSNLFAQAEYGPSDDPRTEGTGVLQLAAEVATVDPRGSRDARLVGGGVRLQMLGRRARWPVMLGLGMGILTFAQSRSTGPVVGYLNADGGLSVSTSHLLRSTEIRHAEVVVRYMPLWKTIRPFLELNGGLAVLWRGVALENHEGTVVETRDEQRSAAVLYSATLGADWRLFTLARRSSGTYELVLTASITRLYTSRMKRPSYDLSHDGAVMPVSERTPLGLWIPSLGLTMAIDSRAAARAQRKEGSGSHSDE